MPCWFDATLKLGDLLTAGAAIGAAWWVGHVIQRRDANQRAIKDLITGFCADSLESLARLSERIDNCPPNKSIEADIRHDVMWRVTTFSNTLLTIEEAVRLSEMGISANTLPDLKSLREELRAQITEPLVSTFIFDQPQIRQIHGGILKLRLGIIQLQFQIIKTV